MISKHPLEIPSGKKLSKDEVADALRLSIIAELDAINLYLQLSRAIDDVNLKKIFEDIAKEEKTHVGEFLTALKSIDPEQVEELKKGSEEVKALTGIEVADPPSEKASENDLWKTITDSVAKIADSSRIVRKHLPVTNVGKGVDAVPIEMADGKRTVVPMEEISVEFKLSQRLLDRLELSKQLDELGEGFKAALEFSRLEDEYIIRKLLSLSGSLVLEMRSWDAPGYAVEDVANAVSIMQENGLTGPFVLFLSPKRYAKLLAVHERTGVMELTRVKGLVSEVIATPSLKDGTALLISSNSYVVDVAVGVDTKVDYLGPEGEFHKLRIWETLVLRPRFEKGIAILKQKE